MATVIRFSRHGSKKRPIYRMVVQHHAAPRDGRFIEHIGNFNPIKGSDSLIVHRDRLMYWLSVGAQMSDSVRTTLKTKLKEWTVAVPTEPTSKKVKAAPADKPAEKKAPTAKELAPKKNESAKESTKA